MSMDLSSLNSIYSLLGSTYGTTPATTQSSTSASFEDYLMNALGGQQSSNNRNDASLFNLISGSSTTSLLNGLTSTGNSNDIASQLIQSLQSPGTTSSGVNNLYNPTTSAASDMFSNSLTGNFQAQIMKNMSAAKAKLQSSYESYVERAGANPTDATKLRIEQMQKNIQLVDNYISTKSAESATTGQAGLPLNQLNGSTIPTSQSLLDQLNAKSSMSQYWLQNRADNK